MCEASTLSLRASSFASVDLPLPQLPTTVIHRGETVHTRTHVRHGTFHMTQPWAFILVERNRSAAVCL